VRSRDVRTGPLSTGATANADTNPLPTDAKANDEELT